MSYRDQSGFAGLVNYRSGEPAKVFADVAATQSASANTFPCHKVSPFFPYAAYDVDCHGKEELTITFNFNVWAMASGTQTVADLMALSTPPSYLQIGFRDDAHDSPRTQGGSPSVCLPEDSAQDCPDTDDGTVYWTIEDSLGHGYPFGLTETEIGGPPITYPPSTVPTISGGQYPGSMIRGYLRRGLDGLTYAGNPDNDAIDTLIPVAELDSTSAVVVTLTTGPLVPDHLYLLEESGAAVVVVPWYPIDSYTSPPFMCVL